MPDSSEPSHGDVRVVWPSFCGLLFLVAALIGVFDSITVLFVVGVMGVLYVMRGLWAIARGRSPRWARD